MNNNKQQRTTKAATVIATPAASRLRFTHKFHLVNVRECFPPSLSLSLSILLCLAAFVYLGHSICGILTAFRCHDICCCSCCYNLRCALSALKSLVITRCTSPSLSLCFSRSDLLSLCFALNMPLIFIVARGERQTKGEREREKESERHTKNERARSLCATFGCGTVVQVASYCRLNRL